MELQTKLYTASEFLALADELDADQRYELVNGEIVEMLLDRVASLANVAIATRIGYFVAENEVPAYVFGAGAGFAITETNLLCPNSSLIYKDRMPDVSDMEAIIAPDLAVEVISTSETPRSINEKTALYLNNGARMVWNVFPQEKVVEVWTPGETGKLEMQPLSVGETVSGGDVLPEFTMAVAAIFAEMA